MNKNKNPNYINLEQDLDIYIKEDDDFLKEKIVREITKDEIIKTEKVISRVATPRSEEEEIEPIERESPNIIGSIFDRVEFLRERIDETNEAIDFRKNIHKEMVDEIEADIKEKEEIESRLTDMADKRNFRMDVSLLRKEMRSETVRFWKDILELRTELRELTEQHMIESKVIALFNNLREKI